MTDPPEGPPTQAEVESEVMRAADAAHVHLDRLFARVEEAILGGPRRYTPADITERTGVSTDETRALWRALGFATVGAEEPVYTDGDLEAVRTVSTLRELGFDDDDVVSAMTRLFGQTFSRLASWQGQLMLETLAKRPELMESEDTLVELLGEVGPLMEDLQRYVWRRQLVAFFTRAAARVWTGNQDVASSLSTELAIGFVDMSGYTTLTRRSSEAELRRLLDTFEALATDVVGAHGGRIVKTIGDEVLFQAETPAAAAEAALELVERGAADEQLPALRGGVAFGPVVSRLGDVYGSTVNIASRLTSLSRPGTVLVDKTMRESLRDDERFYLKSVRPESVRGFNHLHPWRLRRAQR